MGRVSPEPCSLFWVYKVVEEKKSFAIESPED